jgi:hypothetical protein
LNSSDRIDNIRHMLIPKIESLRVFNRSKIDINDRKDAEYDYLNHFGKQWTELKSDETGLRAFYDEHPRYLDLVKSKPKFGVKLSRYFLFK